MKSEAALKQYTVRELGTLAKKVGVANWRSLKKDQLIRALLRASGGRTGRDTRETKATKVPVNKAKAAPARSGKAGKSPVKRAAMPKAGGPSARPRKSAPAAAKSAPATAKAAAVTSKSAGPQSKPKSVPPKAKAPAAKSPARAAGSAKSEKAVAEKAAAKPARKPSPQATRRIQELNNTRERYKDLSQSLNGQGRHSDGKANGVAEKDRVVLLVRDAYWLQVSWEITRSSMERARAAMAENWHMARPILRVFEVDSGPTTSAAERVARDIDIHGGVRNWYIDVPNPPKSFRVEIGYLAANGRFYSMARSNSVTTPVPGATEGLDGHWKDVAEDYERVYALSGGYTDEHGDLQEMFEERLQRPMGSPVGTRYGVGAERLLNRQREFLFEIDAEMIILGRTKPNSHVQLAGEPVKLREDGTFAVRLAMPDRRQVLPIVASSSDGVEQRTIVLAVERNTKVMEPVIHESSD